jgi:pimeloyl-ACP methyl ester carboxylesterase
MRSVPAHIAHFPAESWRSARSNRRPNRLAGRGADQRRTHEEVDLGPDRCILRAPTGPGGGWQARPAVTRSMVASPRRLPLGKGVLLLALAALTVLLALPSAAPAGVRVPTLDWAPCSDQERLECATARVPLDYGNPGGSRIRLAVIRHRATQPSRRIGTLFYNPGGPAAVKALFPAIVEGLLAPVRERFDVISWDLRGLGESTAVKCFASQADEDRFFAGVGKPALTFPVGALEMSRWIERYRAFGQRCMQLSGDLMRHITTAESARDMDLLRRAVDARQVTFIGGSYGTFLGATYANMFPRRVRAMALAAIIDPVAWVNRGPRRAHRSGGVCAHVPSPADRSERAQDARCLPGPVRAPARRSVRLLGRQRRGHASEVRRPAAATRVQPIGRERHVRRLRGHGGQRPLRVGRLERTGEEDAERVDDGVH